MNLDLLAGPALSAAVVGFISYVAMRVGVARLEERFKALDDKGDDRYRQTARRMDRLEEYLGLGGTTGSQVQLRRECVLMEQGTVMRVEGLEREMHGIRSLVEDVQRRVIHLEEQGRHKE